MSFKPLAALIAASACFAVAPAWADALSEFRSFVSGTKSARGEFVQRVLGKDGAGRVKESSGNFQFSRPGRFIWTYRKPFEQVLQADGEKLYIYDRDLNQVTVRKLGNALGSSPAAILFGSNDLEANFTLKNGQTRDGIDWLQATPKTRDTSFAEIGIGLKNGAPVAMELHDAFGQVTLLTFTRFEKNPALPEAQYRFVVPKGADVLNQ